MSSLDELSAEKIMNNLPFSSIDNVELNKLNSSETLGFFNTLPTFEIVSEVSKFSDFQSNEVDINMAFQIDCKYYSVNEYNKLKNNKYFNLFHSNVNSLEAKFGNFHEFLSSTSNKLDILAITETSEKVNENFKINVEIKGYKMFSTSSKTNKGGTALS